MCCAVQSNVVYKFGGSSVRDAERMREVADIICSFPQYLPCVVLSAMGKVGGVWRGSFVWCWQLWARWFCFGSLRRQK